VAFSQGQKTTLAALLGELFRGGHRFSSQGKTLATLAANRTLDTTSPLSFRSAPFCLLPLLTVTRGYYAEGKCWN